MLAGQQTAVQQYNYVSRQYALKLAILAIDALGW
jgi:hypothetical protein